MPTLEITTKLGCSLACTFCPQKQLIKNYRRGSDRLLNLENFKKAVDKLPPHVRIDFSGMAEPWLNPSATDMVIHAYEKGRTVAVYTTLEGLPASEAKTILERFHHKIDRDMPWVVHLPDNENNMPGWTITDEYIATLEYIICFKKDNPNINIDFMTMSAGGLVHPDIANIFKDRLANFVGISRAENVNREKIGDKPIAAAVSHETPVMCSSSPFLDHNGMLPNGDVTLCCMDYSISSVIGNLFDQEYYELFAGPKIQEIRVKSMQYGKDDSFICKQCHAATCLNVNGNVWNTQSWAAWAETPGSYAKGSADSQIILDNAIKNAQSERDVALAEAAVLSGRLSEAKAVALEYRTRFEEQRFTPSKLLARARSKLSRN